MIREIIESITEKASHKKLTLKWKDVFGVKDIDEFRSEYDIQDNITDEQILNALTKALEEWFEKKVEELKANETFAVATDIVVVDGKVILDGWETFDFDGNDTPSTPEEIKETEKELYKTEIQDVELFFDGISIGLKI